MDYLKKIWNGEYGFGKAWLFFAALIIISRFLFVKLLSAATVGPAFYVCLIIAVLLNIMFIAGIINATYAYAGNKYVQILSFVGLILLARDSFPIFLFIGCFNKKWTGSRRVIMLILCFILDMVRYSIMRAKNLSI